MNLITALGYVSEGAGIALAVYGLHRTFRQYAPGQRELDPAITWLTARQRALRRIVAETWRRVRRRPADVRVVAGFAQGVLSVSGRLTVRKGYGYPKDKTVKALVATVQSRTQELMTRSEELSDKIAAEADARSKADDALGARIDAEAERLDEATRDLAIGGLRLQLLGMFLVTLGLVLQGVGQTIG
jgi:hypothetical protein